MYLHVSACMCLYASHSLEVSKAGIPCSSGAGLRGFDPRGVRCFPLSHSGQTAADSSRGLHCHHSTIPRSMHSHKDSACFRTTAPFPEASTATRPKDAFCKLASHGLPESFLACKYNCTRSKKLSYRKYCKLVARYCQIDSACCLNLMPNNDKYLWPRG